MERSAPLPRAPRPGELFSVLMAVLRALRVSLLPFAPRTSASAHPRLRPMRPLHPALRLEERRGERHVGAPVGVLFRLHRHALVEDADPRREPAAAECDVVLE